MIVALTYSDEVQKYPISGRQRWEMAWNVRCKLPSDVSGFLAMRVSANAFYACLGTRFLNLILLKKLVFINIIQSELLHDTSVSFQASIWTISANSIFTMTTRSSWKCDEFEYDVSEVIVFLACGLLCM